MRLSLLVLLLACTPTLSKQEVATHLPGEAKPNPGAAPGSLGTGADAPDFALEDQSGRVRGLGELRQGGPVLVFFYPGSMSEDARQQLIRLQAKLRAFPPGATLIAVSPDPKSVSAKLREELKLEYPLLTDSDLRASRAFKVADAVSGVALPTLFVIDREGKIRWRYRPGEGRYAEDEAIDAVRRAE
jgi:peroxiredoxin